MGVQSRGQRCAVMGADARTKLRTGFNVFRYAYIAFRSSSVMLRNAGQGIGGARSSPSGFLPVRIVRTNDSSVYRLPRPVSRSGVRFAA
jgi:hypothetical protein